MDNTEHLEGLGFSVPSIQVGIDAYDILIHPNAAKTSCNASDRSSSVYLRNFLLCSSSTISINASSFLSNASTTAANSWNATDKSSSHGVAAFVSMSTKTLWKRVTQDSLILHSRKDVYHLHAGSNISERTAVFVIAKTKASRDSEMADSS
jgi:hypothetical protein